MVIHLEIDITTEFAIKNTVKIGGNVVNYAYFTRNIIKITPSPGKNFIVVMLPEQTSYILTHNQENTDDSIYIVDKIGGIAPISLFDLADKLSALIKV